MGVREPEETGGLPCTRSATSSAEPMCSSANFRRLERLLLARCAAVAQLRQAQILEAALSATEATPAQPVRPSDGTGKALRANCTSAMVESSGFQSGEEGAIGPGGAAQQLELRARTRPRSPGSCSGSHRDLVQRHRCQNGLGTRPVQASREDVRSGEVRRLSAAELPLTVNSHKQSVAA